MRKKSTLVKLPNGEWVNPNYVTNICNEKYDTKIWTKLWIVKDAGYGTGQILFEGDCKDQLAKIINQES